MIVDLVCFAKNEDRYIEEWVDYHIKLGFDNIIIYQNDWVCPITRDKLILKNFSGKGVQMDCYLDYLNNVSSDYAAFIDVDEFIVLQKHTNIKDFLTEYHNEYGIAVNRYYFGSQGKIKHDVEFPNSLLRQFTKRDSNVDFHIKTILNLKTSNGYMELPHNPNTPLMDTNGKIFRGSFNKNGPTDVIQINHYYHKTYEDWKKICERGQGSSIFSKSKLPIEWENSIMKFDEVEDTKARDFFYN